jgi:anti-sigma B factor antagonist
VTGSRPAPFSISIDDQPAQALIAVGGELDLGTAPALEDALLARLRAGRHVMLDLGGLEFMDSTGVRVIVSAHRLAQEHGGRFALLRMPPDGPVGRVLRISGLDDVLDIVDGAE